MADKKPPAMFAIGSPKWPGLSKLNEEAGEVVQLIGKLMGNDGELAHWDGSDLGRRLEEEIGDLLAACEFVMRTNAYGIDRMAIEERRGRKLALFYKWHDDWSKSDG